MKWKRLRQTSHERSSEQAATSCALTGDTYQGATAKRILAIAIQVSKLLFVKIRK
jgi:hypothetical protein